MSCRTFWHVVQDTVRSFLAEVSAEASGEVPVADWRRTLAFLEEQSARGVLGIDEVIVTSFLGDLPSPQEPGHAIVEQLGPVMAAKFVRIRPSAERERAPGIIGRMPLPRPRRPDRATLAALGGYAATRLVGLCRSAIAAGVTGKDGLHRLKGRWDSVWYVRIAEHGYGYQVTLPNGDVHSDLAFFPLLPALERGLSAVLPLDAATAGLLVSWTAGLAAAWGIARCGTHAFGPRAGVLLAVLWGVYPTAFVQSMAYTETLFTALAAWSLYAVLRGRWILAGVLCAVAGLTRPTAAALIAALGVTALVTLVRERRLPARTVAGVLIAPLGRIGSLRRDGTPPPRRGANPPQGPGSLVPLGIPRIRRGSFGARGAQDDYRRVMVEPALGPVRPPTDRPVFLSWFPSGSVSPGRPRCSCRRCPRRTSRSP
ncbi:hypothetical protein STANM309S_01616 [Streptomyces tanashiensis]